MTAPRPLSLLCELTYRCNLQCPYCYNPLNLAAYRDELDAASWRRVVGEAADLGVLQVHVSGGEPTLAADSALAVVEAAAGTGLYTNLITQGTFLDDTLIDRFVGAGLDHVQISIQAPEAELADRIAGTRVHEQKLEAIDRVMRRNVAFTLNCVLHRANHDRLEATIALAERLGVRRLELANTQFYGWAYKNRAWLMPTRDQVRHGDAVVAEARERLRGKMEIVYVLPDYFEELPKPCMHGWGNAFMTVTPNGTVLPCPAAAAITTLRFENVRERSLQYIWESSESFTAYRGTAWMPEPCQSCERRDIDFGGCRCQAFAVLGDAGLTDPACAKSPNHGAMLDAVAAAPATEFSPRRIIATR
ncbi:MAG TPA: pyrroloquinoline quinone biosynthesis protein PqqE [Candidatus Acidoferrales bacterium]|nr:pyrroloquinoline quinone biosynthesis protein PqqE [Candidatus Acidoferrales bacterium]